MPRLKREHVTGSLPSYDFTTDEVDLAIDRARAALAGAAQLDRMPDVLTDVDWDDALTVAIGIVTNPEGFAQKNVGSTGRMWPQKVRADEALARVRARYQAATSGPRGSYPPAPAYPEPASVQRPYTGWDGFAQPPTWIV